MEEYRGCPSCDAPNHGISGNVSRKLAERGSGAPGSSGLGRHFRAVDSRCQALPRLESIRPAQTRQIVSQAARLPTIIPTSPVHAVLDVALPSPPTVTLAVMCSPWSLSSVSHPSAFSSPRPPLLLRHMQQLPRSPLPNLFVQLRRHRNHPWPQ